MISERKRAPVSFGRRNRSGLVVGSRGKLTEIVRDVQLHDGSVLLVVVWEGFATGHQRSAKSNVASGREWTRFPPQFLESVLHALASSCCDAPVVTSAL